MRIALPCLALCIGFAFPVDAQTWTSHRQPGPPSIAVDDSPETVGTLGEPDTRALAATNADSRRRQADFDERLADRGLRAIASLCSGCGGRTVPLFRDRGRVTASVLSPHLADAETIYSVRRGFDPAQARLD